MSTEIEQLAAIRAQTIAQLEELRSDPKPSYSLDGQQIAWTEYVESLQRTIDWCDRKLSEGPPFECRSEATT